MELALQYVRSLVFIVQMYLALALYAIWWTPVVLYRRDAAFDAVDASAAGFAPRPRSSWACSRGSPRRGTGDEVLIAAKHQSFFDIIIIVSVLPRPKFIMKKETAPGPHRGVVRAEDRLRPGWIAASAAKR